jgi:hypothetical protein
VEELTRPKTAAPADVPQVCRMCGAAEASMRLPFAVGRQDSPPRAVGYRILGIGPRKKRFVQRYRWVWFVLHLCRRCGSARPSERLWNIIQDHPGTRRLVLEGFTETRLDSGFEGREGEETFTEESV